MPSIFNLSRFSVFLILALAAFGPSLASANWVGGIEFDHPIPSYLDSSEYVGVTVDCKVTDPGGALIYALPITNGSLTPGVTYSGGSVIPEGTTTVTRFFKIGTGQQVVDHVRITMRTADNSATLLEFFVRVNFVYGPCGIFNIQLDHDEHSVLSKGTSLNVSFDYGSPGPDNVRIFARPYFDGSLVPGYAASGGYAGGSSGSGSQNFTFNALDADMNQIHFKMTNLAQTEILLEFDWSATLSWRDVGITNIVFSRPSPSMVHHEDNVDITFDYDNPTGEDILIWFLPYEDGVSASNGVYRGSLVIPPGSGSLSRYIGSTSVSHVNQACLRVRRDSDDHLYVDRLIPVEYEFAPHVITDITLTPAAPALLDYGEFVTVDFCYRTDHPDSFLIQNAVFTRGRANPDSRSHGSPYYSTQTGSGDSEFFLAEGALKNEIDQVELIFYSYPGIQVLNRYRFDTTHLWGTSGSVTPVLETIPSLFAQLGQNHPNPFNPVTSIPIELSGTRYVRLAVYDLRGRLVRVLADEVMGAGRHEISFEGSGLSSGSYFYRLEGAGLVQTRSMMLVK